MNEQSLQEVLQGVGLSLNESRVYDAILRLKKARPTRIAEEAHLSRGTTYHILEYLHKKDLIFKLNENNKLVFVAKKPEEGLRNFLEQQQRMVGQRKDNLEHSLELIQSRFASGTEKILVRYYEGENGFWDFFLETLNVKKSPIVGYATDVPTKYDTKKKRNFPATYAKLRYQRRVSGRYLTLPEFAEDARAYIRKYYGKYLQKEPGLLKLKTLPYQGHDHIMRETVIFDNKYAISNGYDPGRFFGVIIEDENIATTQRIIFESLWKTVKEEIKI